MTRPSSGLLRVIQVSDCHLSRDPKTPYRGQNADRNLSSLLPAIRRWQPDLLLLTGDVSEDASAAAYGRVAAQLSTAGAPVLALPGNHDDPALMRRYFPLGPWDGPHTYTSRNWLLVLLDSTEPGCVAGAFSDSYLEQLERFLRKGPDQHVLLALHHQPVPVNSQWIDRYGLEPAEAFWDLIDRHPRVRCITWGHVHQDFEALHRTVTLLGSPSSVANSLPVRETFTLDLGGPACRWLELSSKGTIETGLLRAV
jgi:Icc protein